MNDPNDWQSRMPMQPTHDLEEALAVQAGDVEGDLYRDGSVWANTESLKRWRDTPDIPDLASD